MGLGRRGAQAVLASVLLMLTGCATTAAESAQGAWHEVRTPRFEVLTEGDAAEARALVQDLERFHQVMLAKTTAKARPGVPPLRVFIAGSAASYEALTQRGRNSAGVFAASVAGNYAVAKRTERDHDPDAQDTRHILFHEYVHYMMASSGARVPSWYNEGFAEYMATTVFRPDGSYTVGCPPRYRTRWFEQLDWLPMARVVASDSIVELASDKRDSYLQAWYAVHYLLTDPTRKRQLTEYLGLFHRMPSDAAVEAAFGMDVQAFNGAVRQHASKSAFECAAITPAIALRLPVVEERALTAAIAHVKLGDLLLNTLGPSGPTLELLDQALTVARGNPLAEVNRIRAELTLATRSEDDGELREGSVERAWQRAKALGPTARALPEVQALLGDLHAARARRMFTERTDGAHEEMLLARKAYRRAIRVDESLARAYYGLGRSYLTEDGGSKEPLVVLETAGYLVPSSVEVPLTLAALLISRGEHAAAEGPLRYVLQWAKDPKLRRLAQRRLNRLPAQGEQTAPDS